MHSIGSFYTFDAASNTFKFSSSKTKGVQTVESPPETIQIVNSHPVIFAAEGSHGLWGAAGIVVSYAPLRPYLNFPNYMYLGASLNLAFNIIVRSSEISVSIHLSKSI